MRSEIVIPEDVTATVDGLEFRAEGPNGTVEKRLWYPDVTVSVEGDRVVVHSDETDAKTRSTVGTFESHVRNAFHGVTEGWEYEMEINYEHFPMQLRVEDGEVVIENFLGETAPRRCAVLGDTEVEIDEPVVRLSGPDKEDVGQTAGNIQQSTRVPDKDTRVFEDGVFITEKPEVSL